MTLSRNRAVLGNRQTQRDFVFDHKDDGWLSRFNGL